jgi:peptidyl-prolyl cis-trans isomerase SurA
VNQTTVTKLLAGFISLGLAVSPVVAQAQDAAQPANSLNLPENVTMLGKSDPNMRRATALVNGEVITGTDVEQRAALLVAASEGAIPEDAMQQVRQQTLRRLIDETLQIQEAKAQEIIISREEINRRYAEVASQSFGPDTGKMDTYLASIGSSANSLKRQIEGEYAWRRLQQRMIAPFINVSEQEARELVERLEQSRGTEEYNIWEIYLSATPATREAVQQNALRIVEQLKQGGSFEAYARQFSDASTAVLGGDLGYVRLETLPAEMQTVARSMQAGQLVGPFEIPGGFEIMYLREKRAILMANPRDAVLSLKQIGITFEPGVTEAAAMGRIDEFTRTVEAMRGCGDADALAAGIGAAVVANDMVTRQLPEQLQPALLELNIGEATPPFGSIEEGVRVLMLCGRDDPKSPSAPSLEEVVQQLENDRIGKRAQRYLRDLRNDAYIEYN